MEPESSLPYLQVKKSRLVSNMVFFSTERNSYHLAQAPSWRTIPSRLSAAAYSIYSQLPSISNAAPLSTTRGQAMTWCQEPTFMAVSHLKIKIPGKKSRQVALRGGI
jgi:hypothetical protein